MYMSLGVVCPYICPYLEWIFDCDQVSKMKRELLFMGEVQVRYEEKLSGIKYDGARTLTDDQEHAFVKQIDGTSSLPLLTLPLTSMLLCLPLYPVLCCIAQKRITISVHLISPNEPRYHLITRSKNRGKNCLLRWWQPVIIDIALVFIF